MQVVYVGPYADGVEVQLPSGDRVHVPKGEETDFRPDIAKGLLSQEEIWKSPGDVTPPAAPTKAVVAAANKLNVDLDLVVGTGKNGNVTVANVKAAAKAQAEAPADEGSIAPESGEPNEPAEGAKQEDE